MPTANSESSLALVDPAPPSHPIRRTSDLLIGRQSIPGARYFLTICEAKRRPSFLAPPVTIAFKHALDRLHASGDFSLTAATVMPEHVHLLGVLGRPLSLSRLMGKLKASTHRVLRPLGLAWQENYYDHRLRHEDDLEPFARYIFLNPYRAALSPITSPWPQWWRWGELPFEFQAMVAQTGTVPRA